MIAADIMTREVLTATLATPVSDVVRTLVEKKISGLPVVDADRKIVGIVTEGDLIGLSPAEFHANRTTPIGRCKAMMADLVNRHVTTITQEMPLEQIGTLLLGRGIKRVPVLDKDGKLAGIVSRRDILKAFLRTEQG